MPELPEVEVITRMLARDVPGSTIARAYVERPSATRPQTPEFVVEQVTGRQIEAVWRRAKNILLTLSGGITIRVHLRMTGHMYVIPDGANLPRGTRFVLYLEDGRAIVLEDMRTLGKVTVHPTASIGELFSDVGPEPLHGEFTPAVLATAAARSKQPAKVWLLDQRRVAGLGNIWAAETLHRARIDPRTPAGRLGPKRLARLHESIRSVLQQAIDGAQAVVQQPSDFPEADLLGCQVYGREGEPCRSCGHLIRRIAQAARSTYYCPNCQKR